MKAVPQSTSMPVARVAITCPHCGKDFSPAQVAEVRSVLGESEMEDDAPPMTMQEAIGRELDDPERQAEREGRED